MAEQLYSLLNQILTEMTPPTVSLYQDWADGVDPTILTQTNPGAGTPWTIVVGSSPNPVVLFNEVVPNALNGANLTTVNRWITCLGNGQNTILRHLFLELEFFVGINTDETRFFIGMSLLPSNNLLSQNIVGFSMSGGVIQAYSDRNGVNQASPTGVGIYTFVKLKLDMHSDALGNPQVDYYVNGTLVATHNGGVIASVPSGVMYGNCNLPASAGGPCPFLIGCFRMWYEDFQR